MTRRANLMVVLSLIATCGGAIACGDDGATGADAQNPRDAARTGDAPSAADAPTAPAVDANGSGGDAPAADTSIYDAVAMPGGLDRVMITRVNDADQTCMRMVLVSPMTFDEFDIDIPDPWRVESVALWQQQITCDDTADAFADGGTGTITFGSLDALMLYPCDVTISAEIGFPGPLVSTWTAENIAVAGVTCN